MEHGRVEGTADVYACVVNMAYRDFERPTGALVDRSKAPKTRRQRLAALRAWALYTGDDELLGDCARVKLPHPRRVVPKRPLETEEWWALIDAVNAFSKVTEPQRSVMGLMACRGFRCGDVLRLRKDEILAGLDGGVLGYEAKGERRLEYRIVPRIRPYLEVLLEHRGRWRRVEDLVSPRAHPDKRRKSAGRSVSRALKRCAAQVGLSAEEIYPHRLRRTYAVHYLRELQGDPEALVKLQQHMQWANLNTAAGYVDYIRTEELDQIGERMLGRKEDA